MKIIKKKHKIREQQPISNQAQGFFCNKTQKTIMPGKERKGKRKQAKEKKMHLNTSRKHNYARQNLKSTFRNTDYHS